jgi:hypothetical protein
VSDAPDQKAKVDSVVAFELTTDAAQGAELWLEPQGMNYRIAPGQRAQVRIVPPQPPPVVNVNDDGTLTVWCEGWASVFIDGVETVNYLPTNEEVAYFNSEDYQEQMQQREARYREGVEMMERYGAEHPDEYRAAMDEMVARFRVSGMRSDEDKAWLVSLDPALRAALKAAGALPFLDLDGDAGP